MPLVRALLVALVFLAPLVVLAVQAAREAGNMVDLDSDPTKLIDIVAIFGTLAGVATSLGLGVTQINTGLNHLYGLPI